MLIVSNISKSYDKPVLHECSFQLDEGDFCVLLGENGAGKSTLLNIVLGVEKPEKGTVSLAGMSVEQCHHLVSVVSQNQYQGCVMEMTLMDNLLLCYMITNTSQFRFTYQYTASITTYIKHSHSNLLESLYKPMKYLSGGQCQQAMLAMAMLRKPKLLILDEHTSALDPKKQIALMALTQKEVTKLKLTTLMVTHQLEDAIRYGNRILILKDGGIVANIYGKDKLKLSKQALLSYFSQPSYIN